MSVTDDIILETLIKLEQHFSKLVEHMKKDEK